MKFPVWLYLFLLSITSQPIWAQPTDTAFQRLLQNIYRVHSLNPYEKAFLHLDKSFYQPGEKIWFSAYLQMNALPSTLSKVVYTDLTDSRGNVIQKGMWRVENSKAGGFMLIPDTLSTGVYRVRAYTLWMLNEPASLASQFIFVQGFKNQHKVYELAPTPPVVTFYPESGQLVSGLSNQVAFRITDAAGVPVTTVQTTLLENGQIVNIPIWLFGDGTGSLEFEPRSNSNYELAVKADNQSYRFPLPKVQSEGIVLHAANLSATRIFVRAAATENFIQKHPQVKVLALQQGKPVFTGSFLLDENQNATVINKRNLSADLLQIVLLDDKNQLLAERWIQVLPDSNPHVDVIPIKIQKTGKAKNELLLRLSAGADTPMLSASIIPAHFPHYPFLYHPDIHTQLLFSTNHQQPIFLNPIFSQLPDSLRSMYADALMMCLQPRRFTWEQLSTAVISPLRYFFETGISVRGFVKKEKTNPLADSGRVEIITKGADSTTILSTVKIDQRGAFAVNEVDFMKNATIYAQGILQDKKRKRMEVTILPGYIDTLKLAPPFFYEAKLREKVQPEPEWNDFLKNYALSGLGKELDEIVIKGKRKSRLDSLNEVYASELFRVSDMSFELDSSFSYATIWQALMELVPGLYVSSATANEPMVSFNRYTLSNDRIAGDNGTSSIAPVPIAFFLNEVPIELFEVSAINPADVALIKVNRTPNLLMNTGSLNSGAEGSILIYTKKNRNSGQSGFEATQLTGYSVPLPFAQPVYTDEKQRNTEDRRSTLLWVPSIQWNKDGTATLSFYNNDYARGFKLVIQGMDKNGRLYYRELILE